MQEGPCVGVSLYRRVSVHGVSVQGISVQKVSLSGSLSRGSLSRRISVQGVSVQEGSLYRGLGLGGFSPQRGGLCLGGSLSRGVSVQGVSDQGVSLQTRMSVCVQGSLYGERSLPRRIVSLKGETPSPPPVNRLTDSSKNRNFVSCSKSLYPELLKTYQDRFPFLPTAREGNVFTSVRLSIITIISIMATGSLLGLVTTWSVRILLECFPAAKMMFCLHR